MNTAQISVASRAGQGAVKPAERPLLLWEEVAAALPLGGALGWSAPGMDQGGFAWIGMAPLFWACLSKPGKLRSFVLGALFGTAYNLVFLQWCLNVQPTAWNGVAGIFPTVSSVVLWLSMAVWQGAVIGAFCWALRSLPLCAGFLPRFDAGTRLRWRLPLFLLAPPLYVLLVEKLLNSPALFGLPWTMLEYSQYQHPVLLQIVSLIGGSGLACAIVLCNLLVASLFGALGEDRDSLRFKSGKSAALNLGLGALLLIAIPVFGSARLNDAGMAKARMVKVSAIQGNLTASVHNVRHISTVERCMRLTLNSNSEICIWPEAAGHFDWTAQKSFISFFAREAKQNKQIWLVGVSDTAGGVADARHYNAIGAIDADGTAYEKAYHKRYLVPFVESIPAALYGSPVFRMLDSQRRLSSGLSAGGGELVLRTSKAAIGPIISFEACLPWLASDSTKNGADLLAFTSNTPWFRYSSVMNKQMTAFSVLRAVENHRSAVFCSMLGPSAIIDSNGRILQQARSDQPISLEADVPLEHDCTPFTRYACF